MGHRVDTTSDLAAAAEGQTAKGNGQRGEAEAGEGGRGKGIGYVSEIDPTRDRFHHPSASGETGTADLFAFQGGHWVTGGHQVRAPRGDSAKGAQPQKLDVDKYAQQREWEGVGGSQASHCRNCCQPVI